MKYALGKLAGRNRQYAGPDDGLKNLRSCEEFGISTEMGILVRMKDKLARIHAEIMEPATPPAKLGQSELGLDNNDLPDIINYALLLYAVRVVRAEAGVVWDAASGLDRGIAHPSQRDLEGSPRFAAPWYIE